MSSFSSTPPHPSTLLSEARLPLLQLPLEAAGFLPRTSWSEEHKQPRSTSCTNCRLSAHERTHKSNASTSHDPSSHSLSTWICKFLCVLTVLTAVLGWGRVHVCSGSSWQLEMRVHNSNTFPSNSHSVMWDSLWTWFPHRNTGLVF